jgi:hypothetical protein
VGSYSNPENLALQVTPEVMKELYAAVDGIEDDSDATQVPREYVKTKVTFDLVTGSLALTNADAYVFVCVFGWLVGWLIT